MSDLYFCTNCEPEGVCVVSLDDRIVGKNVRLRIYKFRKVQKYDPWECVVDERYLKKMTTEELLDI
jgi:hypothetical protein